MTEHLLGLLAVLGLIGLASVVARRVSLPTPVLLSTAGVIWSLLPFLPTIEIDAHIVLAVFLPPLLYADAWRSSWHDFRRWLRPILQLAIGLVAITTLAVGCVAKALMPELPWAACFLLGAILSPTDTVAVHDVLAHLRVPRRVLAILGGESLINDATGLLGVQLALTVLFTGVFEFQAVATDFVRIGGLGLASGIAAGGLALALNARLRSPLSLFVFSLFIPYAAYALAESLGASGVLAVVVAGFVASWRIDLIVPEGRAMLYPVWEIVTFALNALMFLFVGLELPHRLADDFRSLPGLLTTGVALGVTVIAVRFIWCWPFAYLPLWLFPRAREREGGYPSPRGVLVASWCGVRGAVSLAAALALPLTLPNGEPFPGRPAIIAAVLVTIVFTLIGQGATLGFLVRVLKIPNDPTTDHEIRAAREAMLLAGIARLDEFCTDVSCPIAVYRYRDAMSDRLAELRALDENERNQATRRLAVSRDVRSAVWEAESAELLRLRDRGKINDQTHQELQVELDRAHAEVETG